MNEHREHPYLLARDKHVSVFGTQSVESMFRAHTYFWPRGVGPYLCTSPEHCAVRFSILPMLSSANFELNTTFFLIKLVLTRAAARPHGRKNVGRP